MPFLFDRGTVETMRTQAGHVAMVSIPIGTHTVAEIVMAAMDRRETKFRPSTDADPFPAGELCLPAPPEAGIDPNYRGFQDALHDHLLAKFVPKQDHRLPREKQIDIAADELLHQSRELNKTRYLIHDLPRGELDRPEWKSAFAKLKEVYEGLVFIDLSDDSDLVRRERRSLRLFRDILARATKAGST
jgi:hypothetical protein